MTSRLRVARNQLIGSADELHPLGARWRLGRRVIGGSKLSGSRLATRSHQCKHLLPVSAESSPELSKSRHTPTISLDLIWLVGFFSCYKRKWNTYRKKKERKNERKKERKKRNNKKIDRCVHADDKDRRVNLKFQFCPTWEMFGKHMRLRSMRTSWYPGRWRLNTNPT